MTDLNFWDGSIGWSVNGVDVRTPEELDYLLAKAQGLRVVVDGVTWTAEPSARAVFSIEGENDTYLDAGVCADGLFAWRHMDCHGPDEAWLRGG